MEAIEVLQLDEIDIEFADILTRYGLTENEGKVFVYIKTFESVNPKTIMQGTDLTQSVVSVAVNGLVEKGYIKTEKRIKEDEGVKGRPPTVYSLNKSINEIINEIEKQTIQQIKDINESIERLKELSYNTMSREDTELE